MPVFTISKGGKTLETLSLDGDRIEMGSANACRLFIDDLLISLKQAAFVRSGDGYDLEPLSRNPVVKVNGEPVTQRVKVPQGAVVEVEGYQIRFEAGVAPGVASPAKPVPAPVAAPPPPPPPPPLPPIVESAPPPLPPIMESAPPPLPPLESVLAEPVERKPEPVQSELPPPLELDSLPPLPPLDEFPAAAGSTAEAEDSQRTVFVTQPVGVLVALSGPLKGKSWPLVPGEIKIGREEAKNDVVLNRDIQGAVDKSISRRHASVIVEGKSAHLEDQGSVAGTFLNGRQAPPKERLALKAGDQIEIRSAKESTILRVDLFGQPAGVSPAPIPTAAPPPPSPRKTASPPPPPPPKAAPSWEPPRREEPAPRHEEPVEEAGRGRRRERARPVDENPFAPGEAPGGVSSVPTWVWLAAGGGLILIIVILMLFVF